MRLFVVYQPGSWPAADVVRVLFIFFPWLKIDPFDTNCVAGLKSALSVAFRPAFPWPKSC